MMTNSAIVPLYKYKENKRLTRKAMKRIVKQMIRYRIFCNMTQPSPHILHRPKRHEVQMHDIACSVDLEDTPFTYASALSHIGHPTFSRHILQVEYLPDHVLYAIKYTACWINANCDANQHTGIFLYAYLLGMHDGSSPELRAHSQERVLSSSNIQEAMLELPYNELLLAELNIIYRNSKRLSKKTRRYIRTACKEEMIWYGRIRTKESVKAQLCQSRNLGMLYRRLLRFESPGSYIKYIDAEDRFCILLDLLYRFRSTATSQLANHISELIIACALAPLRLFSSDHMSIVLISIFRTQHLGLLDIVYANLDSRFRFSFDDIKRLISAFLEYNQKAGYVCIFRLYAFLIKGVRLTDDQLSEIVNYTTINARCSENFNPIPSLYTHTCPLQDSLFIKMKTMREYMQGFGSNTEQDAITLLKMQFLMANIISGDFNTIYFLFEYYAFWKSTIVFKVFALNLIPVKLALNILKETVGNADIDKGLSVLKNIMVHSKYNEYIFWEAFQVIACSDAAILIYALLTLSSRAMLSILNADSILTIFIPMILDRKLYFCLPIIEDAACSLHAYRRVLADYKSHILNFDFALLKAVLPEHCLDLLPQQCFYHRNFVEFYTVSPIFRCNTKPGVLAAISEYFSHESFLYFQDSKRIGLLFKALYDSQHGLVCLEAFFLFIKSTLLKHKMKCTMLWHLTTKQDASLENQDTAMLGLAHSKNKITYIITHGCAFFNYLTREHGELIKAIVQQTSHQRLILLLREQKIQSKCICSAGNAR